MKRLLVIGLLLCFPLSSFSFQLDRVEITRGDDGRYVAARILGSGFGRKPPPLLYDRVAYAYEKGALNTFFSSYADGQQITAEDMQNSSDAIWKRAGQEIYIQRRSPYTRYPESLAHYYGAGAKANLHDPRVWPRAGTPSDESKLYVSWWFRQKNDTRYYFQFELSDLSGKFNPREDDRFTVDLGAGSGPASVEGRVVHYDANLRTLHAIFPGQNNANRLTGSVLRLKGGGSAVLAIATEGQGSNKFIRVWDDEKGAGDSFRLSWTNVQIGIADLSVWPRSDVPERQWNHMEIFIDKSKKSIKTYVNSQLDFDGAYTKDVGSRGHSPTIGLIGFDASVDLLQEIWMNDIYMDSSFRRITLSNARRHSDITHEEVQYFTRWVDGEIEFDINPGALNRKRPQYIYIYSENGVINQAGIPLQSPPRMPAQ